MLSAVGGLNDLLVRVGMRNALFWPLGAVALLSGLGILGGPDNYVTAFVALGLLIAWLVLLTVVLQLRSKAQQQALQTRTSTLMNFMKRSTEAQTADPSSFEIQRWLEQITIQENGDSEVIRDFYLRSGPEVLQHFSSVCFGNAPAVKKDDVVAQAFALEANGTVGVRLDSLSDWESDSRLRTYVHFPAEIPPHEEFRVRLQWNWPAWSKDLMAGVPEEMTWKFFRPCGELSCTITINEQGRRRSVTATRFPGASRPATLKVSPDGDATRTVTFAMTAPPTRQKIGFTVDARR